MPVVHIEMLSGRSPETKQRVAQEITETMSRLCKVDPAHIYVIFDDVHHQNWAVAGKTFSEPSAEGEQP